MTSLKPSTTYIHICQKKLHTHIYIHNILVVVLYVHIYYAMYIWNLNIFYESYLTSSSAHENIVTKSIPYETEILSGALPCPLYSEAPSSLQRHAWEVGWLGLGSYWRRMLGWERARDAVHRARQTGGRWCDPWWSVGISSGRHAWCLDPPAHRSDQRMPWERQQIYF